MGNDYDVVLDRKKCKYIELPTMQEKREIRKELEYNETKISVVSVGI